MPEECHTQIVPEKKLVLKLRVPGMCVGCERPIEADQPKIKWGDDGWCHSDGDCQERADRACALEKGLDAGPEIDSGGPSGSARSIEELRARIFTPDAAGSSTDE